MSRHTIKKNKKIETMVQNAVNEAFTSGFKSVLHDIEYRIETLMDVQARGVGLGQKVNARDLNLAGHILDGFTMTDNSPTTGSVAWAGCNISYKGVTYAITDGNTVNKYIYWKFSASPNTAFQNSAAMPTLTDDDVLIAINDGGKHTLCIGEGNAIHGSEILSSTVGTTQIANNAVTNALLAVGSVNATSIADGSVGTNELGSTAVTSTKIANGAVGNTQLASLAVASGNIQNGAVGGTQIASSAVGPTQLASGAVVSGKLGTGAVGSTNIASGAVGNSQLATNAVGSTNLQSGAVTSPAIGAGAVAANNLNLASHMLF